MKITLYGGHTAEYGDFPYEKGEEFLAAMKRRWEAVFHFQFTSIDTAEVMLDPSIISDKTIKEVFLTLNTVVQRAAKEVDWNIWSEITL